MGAAADTTAAHAVRIKPSENPSASWKSISPPTRNSPNPAPKPKSKLPPNPKSTATSPSTSRRPEDSIKTPARAVAGAVAAEVVAEAVPILKTGPPSACPRRPRHCPNETTPPAPPRPQRSRAQDRPTSIWSRTNPSPPSRCRDPVPTGIWIPSRTISIKWRPTALVQMNKIEPGHAILRRRTLVRPREGR